MDCSSKRTCTTQKSISVEKTGEALRARVARTSDECEKDRLKKVLQEKESELTRHSEKPFALENQRLWSCQKDVVLTVLKSLVHSLNISFSSKEYRCRNISSLIFKVYLLSVPSLSFLSSSTCIGLECPSSSPAAAIVVAGAAAAAVVTSSLAAEEDDNAPNSAL